MTEEDDIDALAAEHVLGSLDANERAAVNAQRRSDTALAAAIEAWERRLAPLSEQALGVPPPPHMFDEILSRISESRRHEAPADIMPMRARTGRGRWIAVGATALAACIAAAVAVWLAHTPQHASPTHVAAMDCGSLYKDFWRKLDRDKYAKISGEQLAGVSRMALRAYDACQAGDEPDAGTLFGRLRRMQF
jgi:anti-sigma-K factor RskA